MKLGFALILLFANVACQSSINGQDRSVNRVLQSLELLDDHEEELFEKETEDEVCDPNDATAQLLPGATEMQYGFNIVSGAITNGHAAVLDTTSYKKHNRRVRFGGICYIVPDAFYTTESDGLAFLASANNRLGSVAGISSGYLREQMQHKQDQELSLGSSIFDIAATASFANSYNVAKAQQSSQNAASEVSETEYALTMYTLNVKQPKPSKRIIHIWKKLYERHLAAKDGSDRQKERAEQEFDNYFTTYGTHYHIQGDVGGKWNVGFSIDKNSIAKSSSTLDGRVQCLALKLSSNYLSKLLPAQTNWKACTDNLNERSANASLENIVKSGWSTCVGAPTHCPSGPGLDADPSETFAQWKKAVMVDPEIYKGPKGWITQLVDHTLQFADFKADKLHWDLVDQFGESNDHESNIIEFSAFSVILKKQLLKYVMKNRFCSINPTDPWCGRCSEVCPSTLVFNYSPETNECNCVPAAPEVTCKIKKSIFRSKCEPANACQFSSLLDSILPSRKLSWRKSSCNLTPIYQSLMAKKLPGIPDVK